MYKAATRAAVATATAAGPSLRATGRHGAVAG